MLPQKHFRGYEIASETIFRTIQCYSEARRQFHMYEYLPLPPIASYSGSTSPALRQCLLSNSTKVRHESEGKSGPVETGLTGLTAMTLLQYGMLF